MTGSRTNPALPQRICTNHCLETAHNHTIPTPIADLSASAEVLHRVRAGIKTVRPRYAAGAAS
jgi:hypothetical protein